MPTKKSFDTISEHLFTQLLTEYAKSTNIYGNKVLEEMAHKLFSNAIDKAIFNVMKKIMPDVEKKINIEQIKKRINEETIKAISYQLKYVEQKTESDLKEKINDCIKTVVTETIEKINLKQMIADSIESYVQSKIKNVEATKTWRGTMVIVELY